VSWAHSAIDSKYTFEMRGLWKVENEFMGGPFISYSVLDQEKSKILHLYGFVYAPKLNKRNYIRQLDAILRTAKLI
jgi:hypothetical protein